MDSVRHIELSDSRCVKYIGCEARILLTLDTVVQARQHDTVTATERGWLWVMKDKWKLVRESEGLVGPRDMCSVGAVTGEEERVQEEHSNRLMD